MNIKLKFNPIFPGFLFFLCSLSRCLAPLPLKLRPYGAIQICLLLLSLLLGVLLLFFKVVSCCITTYRWSFFSSGRNWFLLYQFSRHHRLGDSVEFLADCAMRDDWITLVVFAELFQCSPSQVSKKVAHTRLTSVGFRS